MYITIELTKLCPRKCKYCLNRLKSNNISNFLDPDLLEIFLSYLDKYGLLHSTNDYSKQNRVHLFGGEPSLYPEDKLLKILDIIDSYNLETSMQSNCIMNSKKIELFKRLQEEERFYLSCCNHYDGSQFYEKSVANMNYIFSKTKPSRFVVFDDYFIKHIDDFLNTLNEPIYLTFNVLIYDISTLSSQYITKEETLNALTKLNNSDKIINVTVQLGSCFFQNTCVGLLYRFFINTDGYIYPCFFVRLYEKEADYEPFHITEFDKKIDYLIKWNKLINNKVKQNLNIFKPPICNYNIKRWYSNYYIPIVKFVEKSPKMKFIKQIKSYSYTLNKLISEFSWDKYETELNNEKY